MQYTVTNWYGISGESHHRSVIRALKERDRREGEGWYVQDTNGDTYDWNDDYTGGRRVN